MAFTNDFNSHTPRGVRRDSVEDRVIKENISTHTPLAGCDLHCRGIGKFRTGISTHTPLAGCDLVLEQYSGKTTLNFNSHTPRGVRLKIRQKHRRIIIFQLTHPSRGATPNGRGEYTNYFQISTHTPLAGCDKGGVPRTGLSFYFNSHTPRGVRLLRFFGGSASPHISTHTPLAGCDVCTALAPVGAVNFNSHTPRGVRPCIL